MCKVLGNTVHRTCKNLWNSLGFTRTQTIFLCLVDKSRFYTLPITRIFHSYFVANYKRYTRSFYTLSTTPIITTFSFSFKRQLRH